MPGQEHPTALGYEWGCPLVAASGHIPQCLCLPRSLGWYKPLCSPSSLLLGQEFRPKQAAPLPCSSSSSYLLNLPSPSPLLTPASLHLFLPLPSPQPALSHKILTKPKIAPNPITSTPCLAFLPSLPVCSLPEGSGEGLYTLLGSPEDMPVASD